MITLRPNILALLFPTKASAEITVMDWEPRPIAHDDRDRSGEAHIHSDAA